MAEMTTTLTGFAAATIEKKRAAEAVREGAQAAAGTAEYTSLMSATWTSSIMSSRP